MPGLINKNKRSTLPLSVSEITSCVRGYTLATTASMTYNNTEDSPIEGLFVYPLDEFSTVVGFEAMISRRILTVQIKDKAKMDDCYFDCCTMSNGTCQSGHIVLDEDLERTVLVVNLGMIPPLETVTVLVSTSSELTTLPNGAIKVVFPAVCTPKVQHCGNEEPNSAENLFRNKDRHHCALGPPDQTANSSQLCLSWLLEDEPINSIDYDFTFHLEIKGPCVLAGVASPSHAIRADADPSAHSASSVVITLADKYTYDKPVEILIYPSEPHMPHILMEEGDLTPEEYEEHLKGRSDFIKGTKTDSSCEKKTEIIRKRLHKDIIHNPVVMLNFCPDLKDLPPDLKKVPGEFIFLIDRSGSMSGVNISRVKDAMIVILKSLTPACLFNVIGFGSTFKTLFPASQNYNEETLAVACEYIKKIRADMGGTNILSPLNWILHQPVYRGHPRLLFLLTDGAVSNTGKVIELVRNHARCTRCYSFGIGQNACRRLVLGLASVSKGTAEFLAEGERLQPKMIKSLKKAMAPVLSDVTIDWLFPATKEVLLSPVGASYLFPGDRLIGYSVVCDTSRYHPNPKSEKRRRYSMMHSTESTSSVFYHSQEEEPAKANAESRRLSRDVTVGSLRDSYQETVSDCVPISEEQHTQIDSGAETKTSPRRRAFSTNQIAEHSHFTRGFTCSDPNSAASRNPLRRVTAQVLAGQVSPDAGSQWGADIQQLNQYASSAKAQAPSGRRPSLLHQNCVSLSQELDVPQLQASLKAVAKSMRQEERASGSRSSTDSPSVSSCGDQESLHHRMYEMERSLEAFTPDMESPTQDCKAVISGLLCGKPVQWEVTFDVSLVLKARLREETLQEDLWSETFHHLAARSVIRDFEQMADKENETEHGSGRRYQLSAIHTSKACNIISKHTAFLPIDLDSNEYLPTCIEYSNTGAEGLKQGSSRGSRSGSRKYRGYSIGLGRSQSGCGSDGPDDGFSTLNMEDNNLSPCSTPSSSGWERCSFAEAPQRSPSVSSVHSQRSIESLFSARLSLSGNRLLSGAAKRFMCSSSSKTSESSGESDNENNHDYLPLVSLQLACGAFVLDSAFYEAIHIPMEKLKWTSPFARHRLSATHTSYSSSSSSFKKTQENQAESADNGKALSLLESEINQPGGAGGRPRHFSGSQAESQSRILKMENELSPPTVTVRRFSSPEHTQADSGRGSETDSCDSPLVHHSHYLPKNMEPEGMVWATAVALAWLEHSSAGYFIEWELVAAKASMWLNSQEIPEGRDLASVKVAARQLFVLLRHWDENLQLNMLCYNPNSV
ncbi:von Willebrand factor A domain-containing protein 5B1-like [Polyodon spathula]|uniref:von Willebrand factor A domain-containing protein 5B1-like n=1 Tax=Polyodon spathula TaxID=7913 RepID=UPI001B7F6C00|nr:von Willebrand factor A domain-containing protein 5B1-like [Polyodon spathula]